jgi:hypothetical protein
MNDIFVQSKMQNYFQHLATRKFLSEQYYDTHKYDTRSIRLSVKSAAYKLITLEEKHSEISPFHAWVRVPIYFRSH